MLRAILFDFNGVLVDDEPLQLELVRRVLDEENVALDPESHLDRSIGLDDRSCLEQALEAAGEDPDEVRVIRLVARKASYYQERIHRDGFSFFPGAAELVRSAHASGITLGLVSGALRSQIEAALRQMDLLSLFKSIVAAEDVSESKPAAEGYVRALQELNSLPPLPERLFHPHEVLAVVDTPVGVAAAAAAGLVTLGVAHTYAAAQMASADVVAQSLDSVHLDALEGCLSEATRA